MIILTKDSLDQALSSSRMTLRGKSAAIFVLLFFWFLWMDGAAAISLLTRGGAGKPWFIGATVVLIASFLCAVLTWRSSFDIDLESRTYRWERGMFPMKVRRAGTLDDFEAVRFEVINNGSSERPSISRVIQLRPTRGPRPPDISVVRPNDRLMFDGLATLARRVAERGGLKYDDLSAAKPRSSSAAGCSVLLTFGIGSFAWLGGMVWLGQTDMIRGASFPITIGQPAAINHRMRDCVVRSFVVSAGTPTRQWIQEPEHGGSWTTSTPYTVTLALAGTSRQFRSPTFEIGLARTGSDTSTTASGKWLKPGESDVVSVTLSMPGAPPTKMFLRDGE